VSGREHTDHFRSN